jgi:hypothetical protein
MEDFRRTSACGVFNDPKLFPIPSHEAMRIVSDIRRIDAYGDSAIINCLTYSEAAQLIENYGAAQRQAGREEAVGRVCKHCGLSSSPCLEKCEIVKVILGEESTR